MISPEILLSRCVGRVILTRLSDTSQSGQPLIQLLLLVFY